VSSRVFLIEGGTRTIFSGVKTVNE